MKMEQSENGSKNCCETDRGRQVYKAHVSVVWCGVERGDFCLEKHDTMQFAEIDIGLLPLHSITIVGHYVSGFDDEGKPVFTQQEVFEFKSPVAEIEETKNETVRE